MIEELTKDCPREDCRISGGNYVTSTCMGWSPVYDRRGNQLASDPNIVTTGYSCSTCGCSWSVRTQAGATTITKTERRADS